MKFPLRRGCICPLIVVILGHSLFAQSASPSNAAPEPPELSSQFKVRVEQAEVPVYAAKVASLTPEQRQIHRGLLAPGELMDASFAGFDLPKAARVTVSCMENVTSAKILPSSLGVQPEVSGSTVSFIIDKPGQLTLEINGDWQKSIHLFADPVETDVPSPADPNVIYFGPGVHQIQSLEVTSGQTVYLARGAVVYVNPGNEAFQRPVLFLNGSHITVRGRGIIDASRCPSHTRGVIGITGTDTRVEGVTLRDSSEWAMPIRRSENVRIDGVKIFGWRVNSDGIDICNSRRVDVQNCFLRTYDDLVVLKTEKGQGELRDVRVTKCVLWNELAHALSLGAELREPLTNVVFSDCDVIRDKGREWVLRVYNCDSALVKNVVFEDIRIEEAQRLFSVWIGSAIWSREKERGHVEGVIFRKIRSAVPSRPAPYGDLVGVDADHAVHGVQFQNVTVGDRALVPDDLKQNLFVSGVSIEP